MGRLLGILGLLGFLGALAGLPASARADETAVSDVEVWNEGVTYFEGGDVTNALRVLRPLMLSKTHGARAAEVVAALEHARGNRDEAAAAAQIALRAHPDDPKANRNFTRATDGLAEAREAARVEALLKSAEGQDPGALLGSATKSVRTLLTESGAYRTNAAARAVLLADRLSAQAKKLADVWIPVRALVANAVTNEQQAATILAQVEAVEKKTKQASEELADLKAEAYGTLSDAEHDYTRFFKLTVNPPAAMAEDLTAQSNAWLDVEAFNGRGWQQEALDFTRAFRAKFPAWARAYEQKAQADTNMPPFTAEDQAKVSALATELEKLQLACCEREVPATQEKALGLIREIRELVPDDSSSSSPQQNPQQQPQQNPQQNQQQQNPQQQDQQQDQQSEPQPEEPKELPPEEQKEAQEQPESKEDQELEALLRKAKERNDEHEEEKRQKMRKMALPPNERDW